MRTGTAAALAAMAMGLGTQVMAQESAPGVVGRAVDYIRDESLTVQFGAGVMSLTEGASQDATEPGAQWTLRAVSGIDRVFGLEAAYLGAALPFDAAGIDGSIVRTQFEGLLRVSAPFRRERAFAAPYATAGLGWGLFTLSGADGDALGIADSDSTFVVPLGVGLAAGYDRMSLDLRFMYRPAYGDDMLRAADPRVGGAGLNSYSLAATLGYSF